MLRKVQRGPGRALCEEGGYETSASVNPARCQQARQPQVAGAAMARSGGVRIRAGDICHSALGVLVSRALGLREKPRKKKSPP